MFDFNEILSIITIRDILHNYGLKPDSNRMPCPIHNGNNKTSFSFNDSTFICFSCGAKGGMLELVEFLSKTTRQDAIRTLCGLAGVDYQENNTTTSTKRFVVPKSPVNRLLDNDEYFQSHKKLELLNLYAKALETMLRIIRNQNKILKAG